MELRKYGVEVNKIVYGGPRLGTYFCGKGCFSETGKGFI